MVSLWPSSKVNSSVISSEPTLKEPTVAVIPDSWKVTSSPTWSSKSFKLI